MKKANTYRNLDIYKKAFQFSLDALNTSANIPINYGETVSKGLGNAAQAACIKIAEGWCRREREGALETHLDEASTALAEAKLWLIVGLEYEYIHKNDFKRMCRNVDTLIEGMTIKKTEWVTS